MTITTALSAVSPTQEGSSCVDDSPVANGSLRKVLHVLMQ